MTDRFTLHHGDCIEVMRSMPDACVDSVVTDPPYELSFMSKTWDSTGIAFNPEVWREALRVLKPGGHLLAFSGSRTYHRMAVAIEDAGFEIRDQIMWIYGSGFPKSLDVSKAIDKAAGAEREIIGKHPAPAKSIYTQGQQELSGDVPLTAPATEDARKWFGYGTALKPAHEPIVVARKPLAGTVAANVLAHGVGALNIDGCRVEMGDEYDPTKIQRQQNSAGAIDGAFGAAALIGKEIQTYKPGGRWPANVIHDGSDEVVALFPNAKGGAYPAKRGQAVNTSFASGQENEGGFRAMGDDGSAARFFYCAKANKRDRNEGLDGFEGKRKKVAVIQTPGVANSGENQDGKQLSSPMANFHPTVKPTDLMRYLIRLVTPQGATILDPFMGSGSTGKAAMYEGVNFIGIEQDAEYLAIAKARIEFALNKPLEDQLFERTPPSDEELANQLALPLTNEESA